MKTCFQVNWKLREDMGPLTIYAMQQKGLIFFLCWPVPNK